MSALPGSWEEAYLELQARIEEDPQFLTLVRCIGTRDSVRAGNSRRSQVIADRICARLDLNPAIYRGNVYGAALARQESSAAKREAGLRHEEERMGVELFEDVERDEDGVPDLEKDFLS